MCQLYPTDIWLTEGIIFYPHSLAVQLEEAARNDSDLKDLVQLTHQLLDLCRSAQRAYLRQAVGPAGSSGRQQVTANDAYNCSTNRDIESDSTLEAETLHA